MLVPQDDDGPFPRGSEVCQPDRLVGEFNADNPRTLLSIPTEPRNIKPWLLSGTVDHTFSSDRPAHRKSLIQSPGGSRW
jgi:hypothetical protein